MIRFFKRIFYTKECYNSKTLINKIRCVNKNVTVEPYKKSHSGLSITTLESTITDYIETLINILDIINNKDDIRGIKKITTGTAKHTLFGLWFTNMDREILSNTHDTWNKFLSLAEELTLFYNRSYNNFDNSVEMAYSMKIRPYIINIENIMDDVIENQVKDEDDVE